ncbi:MAG: hypothetical protein ACF8R7_13500 [Phycisphaerales bacterium JB039]
MASKFAPCADEVWALHHGKGEVDLVFQKIAEQGHYAGRTVPTDTRQGIYALAPSGAFLASINTRDPRAMARMLREALVKWEALPESDRYPRELPTQRTWADEYPEDGLVLRTYSRDLPRGGEAGRPEDWRAQAWNQDFAWFTKAEARQLAPESLAPGAERKIPHRLLERIATLHLVDNVRGQTPPYAPEHLKEGELRSTVTGVDGDVVRLRLEGRVLLQAQGQWRTNGHQGEPTRNERGAGFKLLGAADWDTGAERFVRFDLLAIGDRWGATQYNGRADDPGPAPMGVLLTISEADVRVAPAYIWRYDWQR